MTFRWLTLYYYYALSQRTPNLHKTQNSAKLTYYYYFDKELGLKTHYKCINLE